MTKNVFIGLRIGFVLLLTILFFNTPVFADKTDIVYLKNGDRITGEIKSLRSAKLEFSTDSMGTLYIEWADIQNIISKTGQSIELANGERFYGTLAKPESDSMLALETAQGQVGLTPEDVFMMYPVEAGFWDRLDLSVNFGLSWDKGSSVGRYSLGFDAEYRRAKSFTRASFNTEITTQDTAEDSQRTSLSGIHNVFLPAKKYRAYFGNLESNNELGVDLRTLVGAGYGWAPIRTQHKWFMLAAGLDINHEIPTQGDQETNLEAVGLMSYEYYKYSSPERSFKTSLLFFPSITDWGRWRAEFSTDFRFEVFDDLFWILNFYASYDSAPISPQASTSDYGINSSLGYNF